LVTDLLVLAQGRQDDLRKTKGCCLRTGPRAVLHWKRASCRSRQFSGRRRAAVNS